MNFPHEDQNPEISTQRADALAMAGKILPGSVTMPRRPTAGARHHGRISWAADF